MKPTRPIRLLLRIIACDESLTARLILPEEAVLLRKVAMLCAHLGDSLLWLAVAVVAFLLGGEDTRSVVLLTAFAVLLSGGLTTILKYLVRRTRPLGLSSFYLKIYGRYSFPSGHAARMACIAFVVGATFPRYSLPFYLLTSVVSFSRVAIGIHYLSDVLVGFAIGFAFSYTVIFFFQD
jgi:undecaprenyl-diphosphatase